MKDEGGRRKDEGGRMKEEEGKTDGVNEDVRPFDFS